MIVGCCGTVKNADESSTSPTTTTSDPSTTTSTAATGTGGEGGAGTTMTTTPSENDAGSGAADAAPAPSIDAAPGLPTLSFEFEGPAAHDVYMGEAARMFCFSLTAYGANLNVRLPLSSVHGINGATVKTDSITATVFGGLVVWEGAQMVTYGGKIAVKGDSISFDNLAMETITISQGITHHLCMDVDVTSWSKTPDDFYGKSYVFEMGDWVDGSVTLSDTEQPLPRDQIIAPTNVTGNPVRVLSKDGSTHPERYTGTLTIELDPNSPAGMNLLPGAPYVRMTTFRFKADGTGSCLRSLTVTDNGKGLDSDIDYIYLEFNGEQAARGTSFSSKKSTISYTDGGFLFCLDGGKTTTYTVADGFSANAQPGGTHNIALWYATDAVVVQGQVSSPYWPIAVGNMFTIIKP